MKKGLTLVEILISIAIFSLSFATVLSIYFIVQKLETKQMEYLAFENICLEIDKYSDAYGSEWNIEYFGNDTNSQYYNENFEHLTGQFDVDDIKYELKFTYVLNEDSQLELMINIFEKSSGRYVIRDLNYGGARYE